MYLFGGIFLFLCILCLGLCRWRSHRIAQKVCDMNDCEKLSLLNELAKPFGYSYRPDQDILTSQTDAWQREFGYCALYDRAAVHLGMVFDCLPVYFDYQGRTWLIELWKGQYGINTGGEIGIYQSDGLLSPEETDAALFHAVSDDRMLPVSMELYRNEKLLFSIRQIHWWLTGFCMGLYSEPDHLTMRASITFPDCHMLQSFLKGLRRANAPDCDFQVCNLTVTLFFGACKSSPVPNARNLAAHFSQWKNRVFCRLYCRITRPFSCTPDKILYLYFFLPFAFRRTLKTRRYPKQIFRRRRL